MRAVLAIAAALLILAPATASADTLRCVPASHTDWVNGGQQVAYHNGDHALITFTIDTETGKFTQDHAFTDEPLMRHYDILAKGAAMDESDFIAFDKKYRELLRIRTANDEFQFMRDHGRFVDAGVCHRLGLPK